jgi:TPR repeat protein
LTGHWTKPGLFYQQQKMNKLLFLVFFLTGHFALAGGIPEAVKTAYWETNGRSYALTIKQFTDVANKGDVVAQSNLGFLYLYADAFGQNTKDVKNALLWYSKAASKGNPDAEAALGDIYGDGVGVPVDNKKSFAWYKKSAEHGNAYAQGMLGSIYSEGAIVLKNDTIATRWYLKAADQGEASNQVEAGLRFELGAGVVKNATQAVAWYRKAADQGNARGQYLLATMYEDGNGVAMDKAKSLALFIEAAEQGYASAFFQLSRRFALGKEVPPNYVLAFKFACLAVVNGADSATNFRDAIGVQLTQSQRADAQNIAVKWTKGSPLPN